MGSHSSIGGVGLLIAVIGLVTALLQLKNAKAAGKTPKRRRASKAKS